MIPPLFHSSVKSHENPNTLRGPLVLYWYAKFRSASEGGCCCILKFGAIYLNLGKVSV